MKVCILQAVLDPFKGANHLPLYAALPNVEFTIVCNRSKASQEDLPHNVTVVTVPGRIGSYYYGFADYLFAKQVLKAYPEQTDFWKQFDVIHLNQVMGPALRRLKDSGVPLLFVIHHPVTADRVVAISHQKGLHVFFWWLKYWLLIFWQRRMCQAVTKIVTVSDTMKKRIADDYACPITKIDVVYNGVQGEDFPLVQDAHCNFDVIAVGSFVHPRKGFPYLLEVYKALSEKGYTIADVGRRSDAQIEKLSTISGVQVYGTVRIEKLCHLMSHSRVLISTSLFEGFGLSLIEALSSGHPAFAFGVGAVPEVLGAIDPSLVLPPRDTVALAHAVEQYLTLSPEERDAKGQRYREAVLQKYSLKLSAQQLFSVYSRLVSQA